MRDRDGRHARHPDSPTAIQITLDLWPLLAGLVLLPLTIAALFAALRTGPPTLLRPLLTRALLSRALLERFGLAGLPRGVAVALGLIWLVLFAALVMGVLWTVAAAIIRLPALWRVDPGDLRWFLLTLTALTASLAAVVAFPFTLLRTGFAARQTRTAEENLTTDLINKAVEGLGAQKEVNRLGRSFIYAPTAQVMGEGTIQKYGFEWRDAAEPLPAHANTDTQPVGEPGEPWQNVALTLPNIEVRLGAIYALERIAQDSPRDHIRVMEILCAYLRENAPARDARRHDLGPWPDYPDTPTDDDLRDRAKALDERREALDLWVADLQEHHAPRADIQAAITVIGRRSPTQIALEQVPKEDGTPTYRLDLRKVNLQAADLSRLNLAAAQLDATHLEGAELFGARLEGAELVRAHLERADLRGARLARANLDEAHLEGARLVGARLEGADLCRARLERAFLVGAHLEGAVLDEAHLARADLREAHLARADLDEAHLEGADLDGAHLSDQTSFRPATLRGAGLEKC